MVVSLLSDIERSIKQEIFVENIEIAWIPLADGRRLAARLVLPGDADSKPVPAILEYIPYRRRDGTRARDEDTMYWFAANGYGYARVDISGSGDSDGLIEDEYVKREQDDAIEVIAWLAAQRWCAGAVGMIGISWGGFNGLQLAARQPPALKAVVSLCSTVDRYHDDVHFIGGCLLGSNLDWGSAFLTYGSLPPDPEMVGERRWRAMWRHRLENLELYPGLWLEHQHRDAFWRHGSVIENYHAIKTPVLAVSGWADGYTAAVFRLVENLKAPCKGIVGPWGHKYPHQGMPGPAIGFLQECKRWWDRWLKDIPNGAEDLPDLRLYLQDPAKPQAHFDERAGRWLGIQKWPGRDVKTECFRIVGDNLVKSRVRERGSKRSISSPQTTGTAAGEWSAYALGRIAPDLSRDQRKDDAGSLVFDSAVLTRNLKIVGRTLVRLRVAADKPRAFIAVRLNDVHPDGSVARITYGLLNLTHRNSHARPSQLKAGEFYDVTVGLNEAAQLVPAGHRLRLAISTSYWPMVWPSPDGASVTLDTSQLSLELPLLRSERALTPVIFEPEAHGPTLALTVLRPGKETRQYVHDLETQRTDFVVRRDDGDYIIDDIGTRIGFTKDKVFSIVEDQPTSARETISWQVAYQRDGWDVKVLTRTEMVCDKKNFYLTATVTAFDKGKIFGERSFDKTFRRDNV